MTDIAKPDTSGWIASYDPLKVIRMTDPVIDELGHDVRSAYVETYWLPILGPTAIWATRRMADWLDESPRRHCGVPRRARPVPRHRRQRESQHTHCAHHGPPRRLRNRSTT